MIGTSNAAATGLGGGIGFAHNGVGGTMLASIKGVKSSTGVNRGELVFATRSDATFATERMRIDYAGNVGIGNAAPASRFVVSPPATETIAAAAVITADACGTIKRIDGATVTTDTTNTFTTPTASHAGCCMDVINVDAADTITLDANANFKTAGGANQALGPFDTIRVCSDGSVWYQMGAVSVNN